MLLGLARRLKDAFKTLTESPEADYEEYRALWQVLHDSQRTGLFDFKHAFKQLDLEPEMTKRITGLADHLNGLSPEKGFPKHFNAPNAVKITTKEFDAIFWFLNEIGVWDYGVPIKLTGFISDSLFWSLRARLQIEEIDLHRAEADLCGIYRVFATTGMAKVMTQGRLAIFRSLETDVFHAVYDTAGLEAGAVIRYQGNFLPSAGRMLLTLFEVAGGQVASEAALPEGAGGAGPAPFFATLGDATGKNLAGHFLSGERTGRCLLNWVRPTEALSLETLSSVLEEEPLQIVRVDEANLPYPQLFAATRLGLVKAPEGTPTFAGQGASKEEGAASEHAYAPGKRPASDVPL